MTFLSMLILFLPTASFFNAHPRLITCINHDNFTCPINIFIIITFLVIALAWMKPVMIFCLPPHTHHMLQIHQIFTSICLIGGWGAWPTLPPLEPALNYSTLTTIIVTYIIVNKKYCNTVQDNGITKHTSNKVIIA